MSDITVQKVTEALSEVCDPTLGRPLATSGQLGEVRVDDGEVHLEVSLISPGYPRRHELEGDIRQALEPLGVDPQIHWGLRVPRKPPRQDLDRLPTVKNIIAIAAGKGGVGKSTVAVNVALALSALGATVGMLDADIYGPSLPHMLGPPSRAADKNTDGDRILPAIHRGMPVMSVDFFVEAGRAVIWRGPMIHKLLQQFLEDVQWGELDYLVVDLPPGTGDAQLSLGQLIPITCGLIVTTPQEVALLDVRKAVDMFEKVEVPVVGIIENMSHYVCPGCGHHDRIFASGGGKRLAEELGVDLLGQLPIHSAVSFGGESGEPVVTADPGGDLAKVLRETAAVVAMHASRISGTGPRRSRHLRMV